jgi:hypothetical protein
VCPLHSGLRDVLNSFWNKSPFDINSVVFHFDDSNYGRRSQPYCFWLEWGCYRVCEILTANPIDWLFAACLEYIFCFSIDSSEARKQYDEYCLSIMQTITYSHDRTHFQCTTFPSIAGTTLGISEQYLFFCHQTGMVCHWIHITFS